MGGGPPTGETAEELAGEPPAIEEGGGETRGGMAVEPPQKGEATSEVDVAPSGRFGRRGGEGGGYTMNPTTATEGGKYAATRYSTLSKVEFLSPRV